MKVRFIHENSGFQMLRQSWDGLLQVCYSRSPFQTPAFLNSWWETSGGGEWKNAELWLGVGEDDAGVVVGIAPLFSHIDEEGRRNFQFLGSREIADYLDFIVREEDATEFFNRVFDALSDSFPGEGFILDFHNLPADSPGTRILIETADQHSWSWSLQDQEVSPYISLDGDWENYLGGLKKKHRHEIRRKGRRLEEAYPGARLDILQGADVSEALEGFLGLMQMDEEKKDFLTDPMRKFYETMSEEALEEGWLKLAVLDIDDQMVAAYLFFDYDRKIWLYNSGFQRSADQLSPGWVLLAWLIQWGIENGFHELDFMRGDESYKYRFGAVNRSVQRLRIEAG